MLFVLLLIVADVGFMCLHIILEGAVAHFNVRQTKSAERPISVEGVSIKSLIVTTVTVESLYQWPPYTACLACCPSYIKKCT